MSGLAFVADKVRLTLSFNDKNKHEASMVSHAGDVTHLQKRYATDAVIVKSD